MVCPDYLVVGWCAAFSPNDLNNEILLTKHFIEKSTKVVEFTVIDTDKNHPILPQ